MILKKCIPLLRVISRVYSRGNIVWVCVYVLYTLILENNNYIRVVYNERILSNIPFFVQRNFFRVLSQQQTLLKYIICVYRLSRTFIYIYCSIYIFLNIYIYSRLNIELSSFF